MIEKATGKKPYVGSAYFLSYVHTYITALFTLKLKGAATKFVRTLLSLVKEHGAGNDFVDAAYKKFAWLKTEVAPNALHAFASKHKGKWGNCSNVQIQKKIKKFVTRNPTVAAVKLVVAYKELYPERVPFAIDMGKIKTRKPNFGFAGRAGAK